MQALGYKAGVLICTIERALIEPGQLGYDIDTLVIDGVSYEVGPDPAPVTEFEATAQAIQARLDKREFERTGVRPDPNGAVPKSRAYAAAGILLAGWNYPSVADLSTPTNQAILLVVYADPESNTTAESTNDQKRKALHYMLVMLAGQAFGERHAAALSAYERTASTGILTAIEEDSADWLLLPCGPWATIKAMFLTLLQ